MHFLKWGKYVCFQWSNDYGPSVSDVLTLPSTYHSHVHGFLKELGQGIQHIASRVDNLVAFVQRANDSRKITGEVGCFSRGERRLLSLFVDLI